MIDYDEGGWHINFIFQWRGSTVPMALLFSIPSFVLAILANSIDGWSEECDIFRDGKNRAQIWSAVSIVVALLLGFRTDQALGRFWEGTGLLHQMRGEWFDAISCLVAFSRQAKPAKPEEVKEFRHTLVRLASLLHGCAMHEIGEKDSLNFDILDLRGLDHQTIAYLRYCKEENFNRFEVILHMIHCLVTVNHENQVLKIGPPILSRVYQEFSRGMVNLHNAKKMVDTQFPFPYAQLIMLLLVLHSFLTPMVVTAYVKVQWWAALISFIWVFGAYSLNFIATELEMPFGDDPNDLPLQKFHKDMNLSLLMLIHDSADIMPHTSRNAKKEWDDLRDAEICDITKLVPGRASRRSIRSIASSVETTESRRSVSSGVSTQFRTSLWRDAPIPHFILDAIHSRCQAS